ncbi:MAG: inosine-5-monophosphate dehydrogenase [Acidimicrobiaceae bacterium]|nr:inosine-5-monophosphate dehydrogenase [Acidimicrobiaceae bacterium]
MRVSDLLATKGHDVVTISRERTISDAIALLQERAIGALVVTGAEPPFAGILSERDVVRALATNGESSLQQKVSELMTTDVSVCSESTELNELMTMMTDRRIRHVPVVDDGRLVGLVSIGDVVKARLEELEHDKKDLLDYVSGR